MAINESVQYILESNNWHKRTIVEVANCGEFFTISEAEFDRVLGMSQIDEGVQEWIKKARQFAAKLPANLQQAQQYVAKQTGKALDASNSAYIKAQNIINKIPLIGRIPEQTRNRLLLGLALSFAAGMGTDASAGEGGGAGDPAGGGAGETGAGNALTLADVKGSPDVSKVLDSVADKAGDDITPLKTIFRAAAKAGSLQDSDPQASVDILNRAKTALNGVLADNDPDSARAIKKAFSQAFNLGTGSKGVGAVQHVAQAAPINAGQHQIAQTDF